jgi:hypothetical protein
MVCAFYGKRQISNASLIAPSDVVFRDIVPAREDAISDSRQINLDALCPDVDQDNLEPKKSRVSHHLQVMLPRECRLDSKTFPFPKMFVGRLKNLSGAGNRKCRSRGWLERPSNRIRIEDWNLSEELRIPARQGALSRAVCSSDKG